MTGPAFDDPAYDRAELVHDDTYFEVSAVVFGYGWNTDKVPDGLTAMEDVLDPEVPRARSASSSRRWRRWSTSTSTSRRRTARTSSPSWPAQSPRIYPGAGPLREALAAGEVDVSTYSAPMTDMTATGRAGRVVDPGDGVGCPLLRRHRRLGAEPQRGPAVRRLPRHARPARSPTCSTSRWPCCRTSPARVPRSPAIRRAPSYTPEEVTAYQDEWRKLFQS